eukprot:7015251-Prymnesium_polylepis.1
MQQPAVKPEDAPRARPHRPRSTASGQVACAQALAETTMARRDSGVDHDRRAALGRGVHVKDSRVARKLPDAPCQPQALVVVKVKVMAR